MDQCLRGRQVCARVYVCVYIFMVLWIISFCGGKFGLIYYRLYTPQSPSPKLRRYLLTCVRFFGRTSTYYRRREVNVSDSHGIRVCVWQPVGQGLVGWLVPTAPMTCGYKNYRVTQNDSDHAELALMVNFLLWTKLRFATGIVKSIF